MHFSASSEVPWPHQQSPTVRRRRLGHELRELREQAGLTLDEAAARLRTSLPQRSVGSKRPRWASGPRDVEDLLTLYGVQDAQHRKDLITLTRESRQRGWWEQFSDAIPPALDLAIGLEAEAVSICVFSPHFIGGLFQTAAYARALLEANWTSESAEQLERRVEVRMERQMILNERDELEIRAVLDETVLSRPVGGDSTLRGQLRRLIELAHSPNCLNTSASPIDRRSSWG